MQKATFLMASIVFIALVGSSSSLPSSDVNQNRKKCLATDAYGLCTMCNNEFYLEDNLCYLCSNSCKKCFSRERCDVCYSGYVKGDDGKCTWMVFNLVVYFNMTFALLIVCLLLFGALCSSKPALSKILAGDDFALPKSSKSTPTQSIKSLNEAPEDLLFKSTNTQVTNSRL